MGEWNLYMGYMARAFVSTSLLAWMLHSAFADDDAELDLQDFFHQFIIRFKLLYLSLTEDFLHH